MIKYCVNVDNSVVEFLTMDAAEQFCINQDISIDNIVEIEESQGSDMQSIIERKIDTAKKEFDRLIVEAAATNVLMGITQAGKTKLIADATANLLRYGQTGSLYEAMAECDRIEITPEMSPFLTQEKVDEMKAKLLIIIQNL